MRDDRSVNPEARAQTLKSVLDDVNNRRNGAFARLVDQVYEDLRRVANKRMKREFNRPLASLTESPTAIVNEAIVKLRDQRVEWKDGNHFFAIATRLLGYVISDYKKRRMAQKRAAGKIDDVTLDLLTAVPGSQSGNDYLDGMDAISAIEALHIHYPRKAEVVTLRVLAGRSMQEIADMMETSLATAERDWKFARAWMRDFFEGNGATR